jgi:adenylate cyclase
MSEFLEQPLLIAFTGLNRYTAQIDRIEDLAVARIMSEYYQLTGSVVRGAGGRVVKFTGDGALAVYPPEESDRAVLGLLELKRAADALMEARGWECHVVIKVHFGTVATGEFGSDADRRYDVLGKAVNLTARLDASSGIALSAEAFRRLSPVVRTRFKKHTPPITYIRLEDSHQPRWAKRA